MCGQKMAFTILTAPLFSRITNYPSGIIFGSIRVVSTVTVV